MAISDGLLNMNSESLFPDGALQYRNVTGTGPFECEVYHPLKGEWVGFSVIHDDPMPYGAQLYAHLAAQL